MALQVLQDKEPKQVQSLSVHCVQNAGAFRGAFCFLLLRPIFQQ
jgi:hypothetical protein